MLVSGQPLLDVRAPVEFGAGAFPGSVNLPLINDTEREAVGRCYKQAGQDAAIALGLALISGDVKAGRIAAWKTFLQAVPAQERVLYCFRGGLRSRIAQQWIYAHTGLVCPRIRGGYKALRRYLLDQLEILPGQFQNWVLSGRTGCGKTRFLSDFRQQIDLEGLANHRGSAFGPNITPQPTQIAFENALAIALLRQRDAGQPALLFEDESRNIGSVHLPPSLLEALRESPLVVL
ncbi:MAG: tRNA 2-selenouridine(34) synthase MnmH, partial [Thiothrix sp.]|nr:tRNA 2-selenouridine(34) synthase MnmH [Thiothrix sp.]